MINRRAFVRTGAVGLWAATLAAPRAFARAEPISAFVKRVVRSPENTYFTYPHSNGFLPDARCVIARATSGVPGPSNPDLDYLAFDLNSGQTTLLAQLKQPRMYYALSDTGLMAYTQGHGVYLVDLLAPNPRPRQLFRDADWTFHLDCDISADGKRVLTSRTRYRDPVRHRIDLIDVASGSLHAIQESDCMLDHAHFSPFNPDWVSFCCDDTRRRMRMWAWHRQKAPDGQRLFEKQVLPDGRYFDIGHERAMFTKPAILVVAYGSNSTAEPCGLYEVGFNKSVRLVSRSNRDLHCNVGRDGRWGVVSLQGTYDRLDRRVEAGWPNKSIGYGISDVMLVNLNTGAREFLYRGTGAAKGQPYEVQPSISPDGRWVLLKDGRERRVLALELDQARLGRFLA